MIFVFGSNLAGIHGKGAALYAYKYCGAERGKGQGRMGNSYALPTKDKNLEPLSLFEIEQNYRMFKKYATHFLDLDFLLTPFGTGLAGYSAEEIANIVIRVGIPNNVYLTNGWLKLWR